MAAPQQLERTDVQRFYEMLVGKCGLHLTQEMAEMSFELVREQLLEIQTNALYCDLEDDVAQIRAGIQLFTIVRNLSRMEVADIAHAWVGVDAGSGRIPRPEKYFFDRLRSVVASEGTARRWKCQIRLSIQTLNGILQICSHDLDSSSVKEVLDYLRELLADLYSRATKMKRPAANRSSSSATQKKKKHKSGKPDQQQKKKADALLEEEEEENEKDEHEEGDEEEVEEEREPVLKRPSALRRPSLDFKELSNEEQVADDADDDDGESPKAEFTSVSLLKAAQSRKDAATRVLPGAAAEDQDVGWLLLMSYGLLISASLEVESGVARALVDFICEAQDAEPNGLPQRDGRPIWADHDVIPTKMLDLLRFAASGRTMGLAPSWRGTQRIPPGEPAAASVRLMAYGEDCLVQSGGESSLNRQVFFGGSVPHIARLRSRGFQEFVSITGVGVAASTVNLLDVLWMLPFLVGAAGRWMPDVVVLVSTKRRHPAPKGALGHTPPGLCNGAFFVIVSQLWATLVIVVDVIGGVSVEKPEIWVDFIVGVIAITFALHQLIEERWKGEDEKSEPEDLSRRFGSGTFALLTVIGTFDQILIYAPLLTSHAVTASELEVGIFAASIVTLCVCFLASRIHFVWKALQVIPIWFPAFIVGLMAIIEACYETYEAL
ncbi:unnamed protein product [Durusdinium trenchii]|uniref:Uncharacterized protein n=1 Tax=Durusdinium trenchii TaxID=1381693 RepID=A0ABP0MSQ2_9DINO